jgi:hypothetical protein
LIERHEESNRSAIRPRQEWIIEINLVERGVRISALNLGFPKQKDKSGDADEYNYGLQKYC